MYGEVPETKKPISEIQISKALDILKQIYELMKKLITIIFNLINQIHWIYNKHDLLYKSLIKGQLLFKPLDSIGKGLCLVLTLDKLVKENEELRNDWNNYKKMLKIIKTDIQKYNIKEDELKRLEHGLIRIEKTILSGHCLITFCTQNFDNPIIIDLYKEKNKTGLIKDNKELYNLFYLYLKSKIFNFI